MRCLVVDDALADPQALRDYASVNRGRFRPAQANAFPGLEWPAETALEAVLADFFRVAGWRFPASAFGCWGVLVTGGGAGAGAEPPATAAAGGAGAGSAPPAALALPPSTLATAAR